ncbi:hypothetical protein RAD16_32740 [Bradyrhizobium sp. 18BD]
MPKRFRDLVGKKEIWYSLQTEDEHLAVAKCALASKKFDREWAALLADSVAVGEPPPEARAPIRPPRLPASSNSGPRFEPTVLTHHDLHALRGAAHVRIRDGHIANPPAGGFGAARILARDLDESMIEFLEEQGIDVTEADLEKFRPLYDQARRDAVEDLKRARLDGDFSANPVLAKLPTRTTPKLDLVKAFEEYAEKGGLKGGADGPTAKRWRPKIKDFCRFIGHRDLTRMTSDDAYRWADHLIDKDYARNSVRLVWIASLSATAGFMVERRRPGAHNPFRGIVVRPAVEKLGEKPPEPPRQKGFTQGEAVKILTATLDTPSSMISPEKRAARRWLPWLCAYSGARVNEITSLLPSDVMPDATSGIMCMVIKPSIEKTSQWRTVPIHSHVIEQGFLDYVEQRRKLGKPLFYDPARGRGGKVANPQYKKTAERVAEWVSKGLRIKNVQPNHGWRHLFKSIARHVKMDREVEGFITGHRPKESNASNDYGDRWVATMSAEIEKYPRFDIPELKKPPAPHRVRRRTRAQIAADEAGKTARRSLRPRSRG